ncbi:hypothetical protein KCP76_00135 [Salmonella enterica subsp. enterica serovar Weltevreden]|nr:hypothetical protein KCP76_00135 [Salmonella enterica subsp. enterica serovar Weltevreden]
MTDKRTVDPSPNRTGKRQSLTNLGTDNPALTPSPLKRQQAATARTARYRR